MTTTPEWKKPVISVPLVQAFPEFNEVKEFRSKLCIFNEDRTKVFDVVSPRYRVVSHDSAITMISTALNEAFNEEVAVNVRSFNRGGRVLATFKLPIPPLIVSRNDLVEITMQVRNSYDRTWAFSAVLGSYRQICSNGAVIGESWGAVRAKHIGLSDQLSVLQSVRLMIDNAPKLANVWREWEDTAVLYKKADVILSKAFPKRYVAPILVEENFPMTKWDLYNALTRFSTHDTQTVQRRVEFDNIIARLFYGPKSKF